MAFFPKEGPAGKLSQGPGENSDEAARIWGPRGRIWCLNRNECGPHGLQRDPISSGVSLAEADAPYMKAMGCNCLLKHVRGEREAGVLAWPSTERFGGFDTWTLDFNLLAYNMEIGVHARPLADSRKLVSLNVFCLWLLLWCLLSVLTP